MNVCMHACMHACMYVCMYVCMFVCLYVHTYLVCSHIRTWIDVYRISWAVIYCVLMFAESAERLSIVCWCLQNQLSGYLLRKFKNSNGWQKLWVVFTNFCLFFYKTFQVGYSRWWCATTGGARQLYSSNVLQMAIQMTRTLSNATMWSAVAQR